MHATISALLTETFRAVLRALLWACLGVMAGAVAGAMLGGLWWGIHNRAELWTRAAVVGAAAGLVFGLAQGRDSRAARRVLAALVGTVVGAFYGSPILVMAVALVEAAFPVLAGAVAGSLVGALAMPIGGAVWSAYRTLSVPRHRQAGALAAVRVVSVTVSVAFAGLIGGVLAGLVEHGPARGAWDATAVAARLPDVLRVAAWVALPMAAMGAAGAVVLELIHRNDWREDPAHPLLDEPAAGWGADRGLPLTPDALQAMLGAPGKGYRARFDGEGKFRLVPDSGAGAEKDFVEEVWAALEPLREDPAPGPEDTPPAAEISQARLRSIR
jgi:hypothetical protein